MYVFYLLVLHHYLSYTLMSHYLLNLILGSLVGVCFVRRDDIQPRVGHAGCVDVGKMRDGDGLNSSRAGISRFVHDNGRIELVLVVILQPKH